VGYRLLREALVNRPPKIGPEWPLLLDLADDADDNTRQTACGLDYMMERTQAPRSTVFRWLKKLASDGHIRVAQHSRSAGRSGGKGERAVYEIQAPPRAVERTRAHLNQVPSCVRPESEMRSHKKGPDSGVNEVSPIVGRDSGTDPQVGGNQVSPAVGPPIQDPLRAAPVEGAHLRRDQVQDRSDEEGQKIFAPERGARRAGGSGGVGTPPGHQPHETSKLPPAA